MGNRFEGIFDLVESTFGGEDGCLWEGMSLCLGALDESFVVAVKLTRESYLRDMIACFRLLLGIYGSDGYPAALGVWKMGFDLRESY